MDKKNPLVGKTIREVQIARDKGAIRFVLDGGSDVVARADGDCCSHTWVEAINAHECLIGSPVLAVVDVPDPRPTIENDPVHDCLKFYACEIRTALGVTTIEYRNSSNGYYGGSLAWPGEDYYGGVFDQNVSECEWVTL